MALEGAAGTWSIPSEEAGVPLSADEVNRLQREAGQAVIAANTEPALLTEAEHQQVDMLQSAAGRAATMANAAMVLAYELR